MKRILTILTLTLLCITATAQLFPVQVNTQLLPPFTPYLSDYTAPGAQKLMVTIRVNDPTLSDYTCKFRITIESNKLRIRTKQNFVAQPIALQGGGIPQVLYGEDLAEYFNPNALEFSGITRSQYEKGAKLPEGVYNFTVEVLDFNRSTVVSNKGMGMAWVILNDPPLLNMPRNNTKLKILDPINIPFTWTPRHTGSPNAAFTTEYTFRLVEVWPLNRNPYDAFLSQPVLYEVTTNSTQIAYGMAEPALLPGRKYAWQVQATDIEGRDLFKNQGKSEVFVFQFGDAIIVPEGLYLQSATSSSLNVRWEAANAGPLPDAYRLQYRPHTNRKSEKWYESTTQDQWKTIAQLQPDTEYEVQLRAELTGQSSNYSPMQVFKTLPESSAEFACSSDVQPPPIPVNNAPTPKLNINDVIHAGGYEVQVRKVTASAGGTYSGEGGAIVPWFMGAKVHVTFKDISVNEQFWLTAGEIKTVWNINSPFLLTPTKEVESKDADNVGKTNVTVATAEEIVIMNGVIIATVTKNSDGDIVVYTTDGETKVLPKGKSYAIVDQAGNGYVTDKEGNIAKTTAAEAQEAIARGNRTYTMALRFEKGAGNFGFDKKTYDALAQYYQQLEGGQYIDWKAVSSKEYDKVDAVLEGSNYDPKKVRFEVSSKPITPIASVGSKYTLSLMGDAGGSVDELLAMYKATDADKDEVLGKLNLASYDKVSRNLVIVPVNTTKLPSGVTATSLTTDLSKIYGQAIADWKVSMAPIPVSVTFTDKFNDGESGALTNYTDDMKKVINAFGKLQDQTYYLFLVENSKSGNTLGYMPRSKQAGFIFVDKLNSTTIVNTIAHEIGHGAFNLQHTFKEFPSLKTNGDNLMDYPNGLALYKYQWDHVHDPQRVIGLFEDDADGASVNLDAVSEAELSAFQKDFESKYGSSAVNLLEEGCGVLDLASRYYRIRRKFDSDEIAWYAVSLKFVLCATTHDNCAKKDFEAFFCGFINGMAQELDWITIYEQIEGVSITKEKIAALLKCTMKNYPIGENINNPTFGDVLFECMTGTSIKTLKEDIKKFIVQNWKDPYYQGQATAFIVSFIGPYKIVEKLVEVPEIAGRIIKLRTLSKAKNADELVGIAKTLADDLAKGVGKTELLTKLDNFNVPNVKNWINRLDDAADAPLLKKIDDLATSDPAKLSKLDDLYDPNKFSLPADRPIVNGKKVAGDFTTTKVIDGQPVSVYYDKNGFANLKPYSAGDEYRYISSTLDGTSADMLAANNAIRQKFLSQPNKFKWNGQTTWFEIKDANGNWVKHTWHHYQDGKSMFPVPSKIHTASEGGFAHTGGKAIIDRGLQNIFE